MDKEYLKALQAPLKAKYRDDPNSALVTLRAEGLASEGVSCSLEVGRALVNAGLHQAAGGDGSQACPVICFSKRWLPASALRCVRSRLPSEFP